MRSKRIKDGFLTGILGLGLAVGCTNRSSLNNYLTSSSLERAPLVCYRSEKDFYDSIDSEVTLTEATYIERFKKLPAEERSALLNDNLLKDFNFLDRNNPGIADIIFLKEISDLANSAILKGF